MQDGASFLAGAAASFASRAVSTADGGRDADAGEPRAGG
jgi:hypothetical protein